ncbi:MAG: 50S ribosomal protein L13 [Chlamydiae bacterium]|nr:50S ribosomal protein L13 [Chlamydiota bacterium]
MNKTPFKKEKEAIAERKYYLFDASGKTLGRFASEISKVLRGKHKTTFTPNVDTGDGVIVINAEKIQVTGMKEARKLYRYYTGFMSGLREIPYRELIAKNPEQVIFLAVRGMMPKKTKLADQQLKKLRIFKGSKHNMQAQKPIVVNI